VGKYNREEDAAAAADGIIDEFSHILLEFPKSGVVCPVCDTGTFRIDSTSDNEGTVPILFIFPVNEISLLLIPSVESR
jgi:hypothetical protein